MSDPTFSPTFDPTPVLDRPGIDPGDVLRTTGRLIAARFWPLMGPVAAVTAVTTGLSFAQRMAIADSITPEALAANPFAAFQALFGLWLVASLLFATILTPLANVFVIRVALDAIAGRSFDSQAAWSSVRACGATAIGSLFVSGIGILAATFVGFVLCIVPGILACAFLSTGLACTTPIVVAEGAGVFGSLERSWALTSGRRLPIFLVGLVLFGALMFLGCIQGVTTFLLGAAADVPILAVRTAPSVSVLLFSTMLRWVLGTFGGVVLTVAGSVIYARLVDLRPAVVTEAIADVFA